MKYLAETIAEHVVKGVKDEGKCLFVLPSHPAPLLLKVGQLIEERLARLPDPRVGLRYGVAFRLGQEWLAGGSNAERSCFELLRQRGWYNEGDNLTSLRNDPLDPQREDALVVLLAGFEHIDDQASLADFFRLDDSAVWAECLKRSFSRWVTLRFEEVLDPENDAAAIERISAVLGTLYDRGLGDLLSISTYLEGLDVAQVNSGSDAYELVLSQLAPFRLPPMIGLAHARRGRAFGEYVGPAQEFLNYHTFLDATARKKALEAIDKFETSGPPAPDAPTLGAFASLQDLLQALRRYIGQRSAADCAQLSTADYVYIRDQVLGYKSRTPPPRSTVRRLQGTPPEVFLRAIWLTLAEYADNARARLVLPDQDLEGIRLQSLVFRHDLDSAAEGSSEAKSDRELARSFLQIVLGGIDELLEKHIAQDEGTTRSVEFKSRLCPRDGDDLVYQKSHVAEPRLRFAVEIVCADDTRVRREFYWDLPQGHPSRLLVDLFEWAREVFRGGGNALPAFSVPHLPTVFLARDTQEVGRLVGVVVAQTRRRWVDLLSAHGGEPPDPALMPLRELSARYQALVKSTIAEGFFAALSGKYDDVRKAYLAACQALLEHGCQSTLHPALLKAFLLVDESTALDDQWKWQEHVGSAIATPLHPAVLDMLRHQHAFLCESLWVYATEALREASSRRLTERAWNNVVDLARIERPVFGILKDSSRVLDATVRSYGYVHLLGECPPRGPQLGSRLLLDYDEEDDDDIPDTDLFQETRASALIDQTLQDYRELYAHANDGLSVGAYCGRDIQPVVAGVDSYLKAVLQQREDRPYALRLVMFSGGQDNSSIMRWLDAWRARWQEAEFSAQREYYARCRISIAHRVVPEGGRREQFAKLLKETPLDVMLLTDFGEVGESRFEEVSDDKLPDDGFRQFPILEKTCCAILAGGRHRVRERVLSQRRFALASLNAEVLNRVQAGTLPPERTHVVISQTQFDAWDPVLDAAHECSTWVVCLDPAVDEQLLLRTGAAETRKREIIGFGTGVGAHGESNYTISTEQFRLTDIERRIGQQLAALFERWDDATREQIAETLVRTASQMGGLSLVKATGPSQYVRDYIAYSTLCHLLTNEEGYYCNQMVSLDAFRHWFGDSIPGLRPDLLRLRARIINGLVHIEADVLECKLAHRSEHHLGEALHQVEAGLQRLVARFRPRESGKAIGVNDRPDQRYWWMQLHRLLASRGHTTKPQYAETLSALERLSDGFFSISWRGAVVAFWSDEDGPSWQVEAEWPVQVEGKELEVRAFTAGREMLRRICLEKTTEDPLQPLPSLRRTSDPTAPNVSTVDGEDKPATPRARPQADQAMTEELAGAKLSVEDKNVREGAVERVLLGRTTPGDRPVYWEFGHPELPNRHILVFGASGTGKTYTIQALLCELAAAGQNAVIVDYTNGFITGQLDEVTKLRLAPTQHVVRKEPLPVNPFRQQTDYVDDEPLPEDEAVTAQRVTGVFSEVYLLGDQQKAALYAAIRDGLKAGTGTFDLKKLVMRLESLNARGGGTGAAAATVLSRITPFVDMEPFGPEDAESWEKLYTDAQSRCHVIQLAGFSKDMSRLITEFALIDLYRYYRARGSKDRPRVVVLDEIQNLDLSLDSPLGQLLTEGRKFGVSLILATQTLSSLDKDARDRLFQASHKLFFKPADTEVKSFAQILENSTGEKSDEWVRRLSGLARGECYSLGPARLEARGGLDLRRTARIKVTSLQERFDGAAH